MGTACLNAGGCCLDYAGNRWGPRKEEPMRRAVTMVALLVLVVLHLLTSNFLYAADSSIKAEELVTRHLDAIGAADARAAAKTRVVQGAAVYRIVVGGGGRLEGKTGLVSEGHKVRFMLKCPQEDYRGGECGLQWRFDGGGICQCQPESLAVRIVFVGTGCHRARRPSQRRAVDSLAASERRRRQAQTNGGRGEESGRDF